MYNLEWLPKNIDEYLQQPFVTSLNFLKLKNKKIAKKYHLDYQEKGIWYILFRLKWANKESYYKSKLGKIDLNTPISWSILSLYPKAISSDVLGEILKIIQVVPPLKKLIYSEIYNFRYSNGYTYEIISGLQNLNSFDKHYPELNAILARKEGDYVPLNQWLNVVIEQNANAHWLDPRLSEWTFIEIIVQIINRVRDRMNNTKDELNFQNYYIHPVNYLIPKEWLESKKWTWNEWSSIVMKNPRIELAEEGELIDDHRYFPVQRIWNNHTLNALFGGKDDIPLIIGYSVLLVKMLTKTFEWPASANKISFIDRFYSTIYVAIERESLSSDLRILLGAIFSKTDIDLFFEKNYIKLSENEHISDLAEFTQLLVKIQNSLSHSGDARQLVFINLDDLNQSKENFFEEL